MKSIFTIIRGLPGSGKSTLAVQKYIESHGVLVQPDDFLYEHGVYHYTAERYQDALDKAENAVFNASMRVDRSQTRPDIIYADVLPTRKSVEAVKAMVFDAADYEFEVITMRITAEESKARNRHGVKPEDIDHMAEIWED